MSNVAFDFMPNNILTPLAFFEVRGAQTPFYSPLRLLLMGHKNATGGAATLDTPYRLSKSESVRLFGNGSMVERMYDVAFKNSPYVEVWGLATPPAGGGIKAVRRLEVTSVPTFNGIMTFYVGAQEVQTIVYTTDTTTTIAARIRTVINRRKTLSMTALAVGSDPDIIELQCKWVGESGNNISVERSVWGSDNTLANTILTVGSFTAGVGNSDLAAGLASLGDEPFDIIAVGFEGVDAQLAQLAGFMNPSSGRWNPLRQIFGHFICTRQEASYSDLVTFADARNDAHSSVIGVLNSPTPPWVWAAGFGAVMALHWDAPPQVSRPLQTLPVVGVEPPRSPLYWFTNDERNGLLDAGVATYTVDRDRTVRIERIRTLYKTNVYGDPDASLSDAITLFQAMFFCRSMKTIVDSRFPRHGLTDDDTNIEGFTSPGRISDALIHNYIFLAKTGLVENVKAFVNNLVVERNAFDANRVDCLMKPDMVNQFRVFAALVEITLQSLDF